MKTIPSPSIQSKKNSPLLFFVVFACSFLCNAQSFPVTITVQTLGASPTQLSSFADAAQVNGPLRVTLTLNDLNITGREIQLRSSFLGNGINFQSAANPVGASPFFLDGGIPLTLNAAKLAPYFEVSNLTGISPAVYGRTLQEGAYQICFEVFDVLTGKRLSARSCANVFIFQNRPPFLVLPQNGVQVDLTNPQNIVFQWTPRQLNVTHVEYELSLVELWDNTLDPQAAFLSTPPIFQTTTRATSYLYGPADPVLLPNHAYAWRVRAKTVDGAEAIGQFENQGYSEIFSFVHLAPCELPPNLRHEVRGSGQANILWDDPSTEVPEFTVRYRQKGEGNAWFLNRTNANWTTLWYLKPGRPYEYQLKKDCGLGESGWSTVRQFTTALETKVEELYQCGISPGIDIQNEKPLPGLLPGQQFTAGDFTVIVTQVNGGEGYYSGKGYVRIPYLGNIKLAVYFDNVLLNTDRQLLKGTVITEFDPTMRNIVDTQAVGEIIGSIKELLESFTGTPEQIQQLQEENQQQGSYVDELLADESIPQNVRNELKANHDAYNASSQNLIDEATQGGPNPDGYDTSNQIQAYNDLEKSIKKAESYQSGTNAEDDFGLEVSFSDDDLFELSNVSPSQEIFLSPAGVPVVLPDGATPAFYKVRTNAITAYGALASFTSNDGTGSITYYGHKKGTQFTGYKVTKDSTAYEFGTLSVKQPLRARIIDKGLVPTCEHLYYEGDYYTNNINKTGTGTLVTSFNFTGDLDLLTIDEQDYSDCLPEIDYEHFTNYVVGIYNYFGQGGFTRRAIANNGTIIYLHSMLDDLGILRHYQYNTSNGLWQQMEVPAYDVDTAGELNYLFEQVFSTAAGHLVLDALGTVPLGGEFFDFANGVWFTVEGDGESAMISFASTIPLIYTTTGKYLGKVVKLANGTTVMVKFSKEATERLVNVLKRLDLNAAQLKKLGDDLVDKEFAEAVAGNPELIESWKVLSNGKASLRNIDNINAVDAFKKANPDISDDAIQSAFDGLKASRKQSFVDALGSCADNKNLIGSLKKSKLASVEEIKGALNKMRDYKTGKPQAGNLGYLEGNVSGATIDGDKFWKSVSIAEARKETHIFDAIDATGSSGTWKRITDSEYRMLNDLAKRLGGVKGQVKESITGSLKIVSENPYCASCQGVIQQFSDMFPNVEITLIDGVK